MKYNNETQKLINDNISSNEEMAERYSDEPEKNNHSVEDTKAEEEAEDEEDDGIDNGSLASKLLNRETCV